MTKSIIAKPKYTQSPTHPWGTVDIFESAKEFARRSNNDDDVIDKSYYIYLLQDFLSHEFFGHYVADIIFVPEEEAKREPYRIDTNSRDVYDLKSFNRIYNGMIREWINKLFQRTGSSLLVILGMETCFRFAKYIEDRYNEPHKDFPRNFHTLEKELKKDVTAMISGSELSFHVKYAMQFSPQYGYVSQFFPVDYAGVAEITRCQFSESFTETEISLSYSSPDRQTYEIQSRYFDSTYANYGSTIPCRVLTFLSDRYRTSVWSPDPESESPFAKPEDFYSVRIGLPLCFFTGEFKRLNNGDHQYFSLRSLLEGDLLRGKEGELFKPIDLKNAPFSYLVAHGIGLDPIYSEIEIKQKIKSNTMPNPYLIFANEHPNRVHISEKLIRPVKSPIECSAEVPLEEKKLTVS
jgi:hypothetical protein